MKFYGRKEEIAELRYRMRLSAQHSHITVITGQRNVGKTRLVMEALWNDSTGNIPFVYFLAAGANIDEPFSCEWLRKVILEVLGEDIGSHERLVDAFRQAVILSERINYTLVLDEIHQMLQQGGDFFAEMQDVWDVYRYKTHLNLVLVGGSVRTSLKGVSDGGIHLRPFAKDEVGVILSEYNPEYAEEDLQMLYEITGGNPRYIELFLEHGNIKKEDMLRDFFNSQIFIEHGYSSLMAKFGRKWRDYFAVLDEITKGNTSEIQIVDTLVGRRHKTRKGAWNIIGNLADHEIIGRKAISEGEGNVPQNIEYEITDNLLAFWFRYAKPYMLELEIGRGDLVYKVLRPKFFTK